MERLKDLRLQKQLLQKDIAAFLGIERTTYVKYENGVSEPNHEMLKKLADYFEVSIDYLLGRKDIEAKPIIYTDAEQKLITAYRAHPEMHEAVHRILGIEEAVPSFRLVAYGGDNVDNDTPTEPRIT